MKDITFYLSFTNLLLVFLAIGYRDHFGESTLDVVWVTSTWFLLVFGVIGQAVYFTLKARRYG